MGSTMSKFAVSQVRLRLQQGAIASLVLALTLGCGAAPTGTEAESPDPTPSVETGESEPGEERDAIADPQTGSDPSPESAREPAAATDSDRPTLSIGATGLGAIDREMPFDRDRIQTALPNHQVEASQVALEGQPYPVLQVYDNNALVAEIRAIDERGQRIDRITVYSDEIPGPQGATVGMRYDQTPGSAEFDCMMGESITTGYVLCHTAGNDSLQYHYGPLGDDSSLTQLPADSTLNRTRLARLEWLAPLD